MMGYNGDPISCMVKSNSIESAVIVGRVSGAVSIIISKDERLKSIHLLLQAEEAVQCILEHNSIVYAAFGDVGIKCWDLQNLIPGEKSEGGMKYIHFSFKLPHAYGTCFGSVSSICLIRDNPLITVARIYPDRDVYLNEFKNNRLIEPPQQYKVEEVGPKDEIHWLAASSETNLFYISKEYDTFEEEKTYFIPYSNVHLFHAQIWSLSDLAHPKLVQNVKFPKNKISKVGGFCFVNRNYIVGSIGNYLVGYNMSQPSLVFHLLHEEKIHAGFFEGFIVDFDFQQKQENEWNVITMGIDRVVNIGMFKMNENQIIFHKTIQHCFMFDLRLPYFIRWGENKKEEGKNDSSFWYSDDGGICYYS